MDSADVVVRLQGVRKAFNVGTGIETEVLHGIDLTLHRGDFCAVMGPSGSGKSTLLNIIGLLDRPTSGMLQMAGEETTRLADQALTRLRGHHIGFVFQYHHLISAFTALENVMLPLLGAAGFPNSEMRDGGQQQRVSLARALAMKPALLLADEPTGNLDTKSADAVFALLRRINQEQGTTVLLVTHNPELGKRCDKTIQVVDGQIQT
ncbi:ABC transporter ATP-binding protein [Limnohabitans sp.]|uniref:ABC transporter ATP-binding protein n=1 Tax=Limnohabitans sp. TaxID=1907725 RepID=UPI0039BCFE89|nr:ABC transporter ATP-binding protein [Comamonadaceae bacterium]